MSFSAMMWAQWPLVTPRPTDEEFKAAEARYEADRRRCLEEFYDDSDWQCGLKFVMATYNREMWWHFFFPEERHTLTLEGWKLVKSDV